MKKPLTFLVISVCILSSARLFSQNRSYTPSQTEHSRYLNTSVSSLDTIHYITPPGVHYTATDGGYVCGTNVFGDLGKYQKFNFNQNVIALSGLVAVFAQKGVVGTADSINFVVKGITFSGAPGSTILSKTITTNEIDTTATTAVNFNHALFSPDSVFIGFEWTAATDDSFGLVSDVDGGGLGERRAWEKWNTGQYAAISSSWDLDIDLWIGAVVQTTTGVEIVTPSGFSLNQNYPNPFNPETKISFTLSAASKVIIKIYDLLGEEITTLVDKDFSQGSHIMDFNAASLPAGSLTSGVYFYELKSENYDGIVNTLVKKMILAK